jgi:SAM-dependent methyltransferase
VTAAPDLAGELAAIRESYDTVAADYADLLRGNLAGQPYDRAVLGLFAELVADGGGGPVADVGCGPGRITAHLAALGLDAFGIDLSPAMIEIARRDHPGLTFEVGSMTDLALEDAALGGLLGWYSLIHLPDEVIPGVLGRFLRVLRPGGLVLLAFHVGDESRLKTSGYGGHPMRLYVHRRPPERVAGWLADAGFVVDTRVVREPEGVETVPQAYLLARKPTGTAGAGKTTTMWQRDEGEGNR